MPDFDLVGQGPAALPDLKLSKVNNRPAADAPAVDANKENRAEATTSKQATATLPPQLQRVDGRLTQSFGESLARHPLNTLPLNDNVRSYMASMPKSSGEPWTNEQMDAFLKQDKAERKAANTPAPRADRSLSPGRGQELNPVVLSDLRDFGVYGKKQNGQGLDT